MRNIYSGIKKSLIFVLTAFVICVPFTFAAFDCANYVNVVKDPRAADSVLYLLCPLQSAIWLGLYFGGAVLIILVLYGGIKALMSTGDARQLEGAKLVWTYAIFGVLIIILAIVIIQIIFKLLGSGNDPLTISDSIRQWFNNFMLNFN
jgi:hypothetical protein